jgi:hypothetical protein
MKYKLTDKTITYCGRTLHRIQALKDFSDIKAGDLGGWIESEGNLNQEGNCWVADNAYIYYNARVSGNALVFEDARVLGMAVICENARVFGNARVYGNARVFGNAHIYENARVFDNAEIKNGYVR